MHLCGCQIKTKLIGCMRNFASQSGKCQIRSLALANHFLTRTHTISIILDCCVISIISSFNSIQFDFLWSFSFNDTRKRKTKCCLLVYKQCGLTVTCVAKIETTSWLDNLIVEIVRHLGLRITVHKPHQIHIMVLCAIGNVVLTSQKSIDWNWRNKIVDLNQTIPE